MKMNNENEQKDENVTKNRTPIIIACILAVVVIAIVTIVVFVSKGKQQEEGVTSNQQIKEETQEIVTENVEKEEVEKTQETEGSVEQTKGYETPEEWVDSLKLETPTILIWNSETKENKIIEDNEEYELKENDKVLLTTSARFDTFKCIPTRIYEGFEPLKQKYLEVSLNVVGKQEVTFELEMEGKTYSNTVVLIGTSAETADTSEDLILVKEDIDVNSELPGKEWIISIGTDIKEPFIAVWNDEEGTKKIMEEGEEYQIKEGDVFFVYLYKYYYFEFYSPIGIVEETESLENGQILQFCMDEIQKETVVTFGVRNPGEELYEISCILTK